MVQVHEYERAIDLFYEAKNGDGPAPEDWSLEACHLFEWLGEDPGRCEVLDFLVNQEFPHGADRDEYHNFFRDEWKMIAEECGCPEHYLKHGY